MAAHAGSPHRRGAATFTLIRAILVRGYALC
jgi:hypothetical protein